MELIISERNGWKKPVTIEKAITRLGSSPACDVQLISSDIDPIHLQIYYMDEAPTTCKLLNLGSPVMINSGDQLFTLSSLDTIQIQNGSQIELGQYHIQFILPFSATTIQDTPSIQATLKFPEATLFPDRITTGWLTIKNTGSQSSCQVDIDLTGLPSDCMQVDPAPLLYTGGQEDVRIQLFHHKLYPAAGFQELVVYISACDAYPGEQVVINQGIYVSPFFGQSMEIFDDLTSRDPAQTSVKPELTAPVIKPQSTTQIVRSIPRASTGEVPEIKPVLPMVVQPEDLAAEVPVSEPEIDLNLQEAVTENAPVPEETTPAQPPVLKVVRNPSDDFWEKE